MNHDLQQKLASQENLLDSFLVKHCREEADAAYSANKFQETYTRYVFLHDGHPMLGQRLVKALEVREVTLKGAHLRGVAVEPKAAEEIEKLIEEKAKKSEEVEEAEEAEEAAKTE